MTRPRLLDVVRVPDGATGAIVDIIGSPSDPPMMACVEVADDNGVTLSLEWYSIGQLSLIWACEPHGGVAALDDDASAG